MNYFLSINNQPPLVCNNLAATLEDIKTAIEKGYFCKTDDSGNSLYVALGDGSHIALVSEEAMQEKRRESIAAAQRAQGLIVPGGSKREDWPWRLVIQFSIGGQHAQFNPIPYETRGEAENAVKKALHGEVLEQVSEPEHDYLWVFPGPNVTYMVVSKEHLEKQQRLALQAQMRAAQQQQPRRIIGG